MSFTDVRGSVVAQFKVDAGTSLVQLPEYLVAGLYAGRFISANGESTGFSITLNK